MERCRQGEAVCNGGLADVRVPGRWNIEGTAAGQCTRTGRATRSSVQVGDTHLSQEILPGRGYGTHELRMVWGTRVSVYVSVPARDTCVEAGSPRVIKVFGPQLIGMGMGRSVGWLSCPSL